MAGCGRTYQRPAPVHAREPRMESDDPAVAAMHLAYAATFDPSVYLACGRCSASTRRLLPQPPMMPPRGHRSVVRYHDVYRKMPRTPLRAPAICEGAGGFCKGCGGGADAGRMGAAGGGRCSPPGGETHPVQELRRARQALDTADLVRHTGFLNRMMPPSELDPFLAAVDAANISAAFSLLGLDACDQSTPRMLVAAIVQI
eukprot:jgi/Tetstr1/426065/TSEL_016396.t1